MQGPTGKWASGASVLNRRPAGARRVCSSGSDSSFANFKAIWGRGEYWQSAKSAAKNHAIGQRTRSLHWQRLANFPSCFSHLFTGTLGCLFYSLNCRSFCSLCHRLLPGSDATPNSSLVSKTFQIKNGKWCDIVIRTFVMKTNTRNELSNLASLPVEPRRQI